MQVKSSSGPEFKEEDVTEIQKLAPPLNSDRKALLLNSNAAGDLESGDKQIEPWTIFAWAVREVMSNASGLPLSEQ